MSIFFNAFLNFFKKVKAKKNKTRRNSHHESVDNRSCTNTSHTSNHILSNASEGRNFQFIDGRRFNGDNGVDYLLPNDNDEADRLHQQHWIIRYVFQGNYHAPLKDQLEKGIAVLDAGCGPATWTFDMAESYPNSQFTGIDVSFVFPEAIRPPNVDFHICNVSKEIPFADDSFDYFHQRLLVFALTKEQWQNALKNAYRVLKPGGFIELVETNANCYHMGPEMAAMQKVLTDLMTMRTMLPNPGFLLEELLSEAGFINFNFQTVHIPINHTSKVGELWWKDLMHGYEGIRPMLVLGNPAFEDIKYYEDYVERISQECIQYKTDFVFYIAYAQKPF
ncbi:S-adenosyl-L-methionine-dependent methyltransferase [Pilobolus umbonatus]|nr:S-adenosyl-L-methionine-dependent methyltransferase [Pilobolus umbonatus]